jgi:hypothetical protein
MDEFVRGFIIGVENGNEWLALELVIESFR